MSNYQMGAVESRFADIIWENEPIPSMALVPLAEKALGWKKSTTYTVLRRLCEKGIFKNADGKVSSILSKEELHALQSENFVEETFDGSLPAFFAAFTKRKKLSDNDIDEIRKMISEYGKGE